MPFFLMLLLLVNSMWVLMTFKERATASSQSDKKLNRSQQKTLRFNNLMIKLKLFRKKFSNFFVIKLIFFLILNFA